VRGLIGRTREIVDGAGASSGGSGRLANRAVLLASAFVSIGALAWSVAAAAAVTVSARITPSQVAIAQRAQVTVVVEGTTRSSQPEFTQVDDLDVLYVGPTTQFSSVNGAITQSVSYRYLVSSRTPGRYRLGPFRVRMGSETFASEAVELQVTAQPQATGPAGARRAGPTAGDDAPGIHLQLAPAKTSAYVGERVPLSVRLVVGSERVDQVQYPRLGGDGFAIEDFAEPLRTVEHVDGQSVRVLDFRSHLTALRAGPLALGPATMDVTLIDQRRSQNDLFGLDFGFGRRRNATLRSKQLDLDVHPLPTDGRPPAFSGAIGQFDFTMTASPADVAAGDPVTVRIDVRGVGNLTGLVPPAVAAGDDLKTYEPLALKEESAVDHYAAEQVVIPLSPTVSEVPAVSFVFFDPESSRYRTIVRGPLPLRVASAAGAVRSQVIVDGKRGGPAPEPEQLGRDIVYIKDHPGSLHALDRRPPWVRAWFLCAAVVPVLAFLLSSAYVQRRDRFAADPRLRRFRDAGRTARAALTELQRRGDGDDRFYDDLSSVMRAYLAAKLDLPPGAVDKSRVLDVLADGSAQPRHGAVDGRRVAELFDLLERVHYAGSLPGGDRAATLTMARDVVKALESDKGLLRKLAATTRAVVLSLAVAVGLWVGWSQAAAVAAAAPAGSDPLTSFYQGNAAYKDGRYEDAVQQYRATLADGGHSAAVDYNLGNAYFKSDRIGSAIASYERALREAPRDPDVRANLAFALETARIERPTTPLWARVAFPLASHATTAELGVVVLVLWWAAWSIAIVRVFVPSLRDGLRPALWLGTVVTALVLANLVARVWTVDHDGLGVVVATEDAVVRYEPSESGVEYYRAPEGTMLVITGERPRWLQVRRDDGLRGWIRSSDLERL